MGWDFHLFFRGGHIHTWPCFWLKGSKAQGPCFGLPETWRGELCYRVKRPLLPQPQVCGGSCMVQVAAHVGQSTLGQIAPGGAFAICQSGLPEPYLLCYSRLASADRRNSSFRLKVIHSPRLFLLCSNLHWPRVWQTFANPVNQNMVGNPATCPFGL